METSEENASEELRSFDEEIEEIIKEEKESQEQISVLEQKSVLVATEGNETFELEATDSVETPVLPLEESYYRHFSYERKEEEKSGSDSYGDQFVEMGSYEGASYGAPAFSMQEEDGGFDISYGILSNGAFISPNF